MAEEFEGYCVKCRKKQKATLTTQTKTKKGVPMKKGTCKVCGCKMCRIGG